MKYLATPNFSEKLLALSAPDLQKASALVSAITHADSLDDLVRDYDDSFSVDKLIMLRNYDVMLVGSMGENDEFILLDIIAVSGTSAYAARDPKRNKKYNPTLNSRINPKVNSQINPKVNSQINPKWNSQINPKWNSQINPKWNSKINPKWNSQINPKWNSSLNPKWNSSLNPKLNTAFSGPFIYETGLNRTGYVIRANPDVLLLFNMDAGFIGTAVRNSQDGYVAFDDENEWTAHWVKVEVEPGDPVYLIFSLDSDWLGLVI